MADTFVEIHHPTLDTAASGDDGRTADSLSEVSRTTGKRSYTLLDVPTGYEAQIDVNVKRMTGTVKNATGSPVSLNFLRVGVLYIPSFTIYTGTDNTGDVLYEGTIRVEKWVTVPVTEGVDDVFDDFWNTALDSVINTVVSTAIVTPYAQWLKGVAVLDGTID
jgi:hypothetical protein